MIALFNGALLNQEKDIVEVPYLEGYTYSEALVAKYKDFKIRLMPKEYGDYAQDQIIKQEPMGGEKVQRGSDIWITVSMGPEPPEINLDNVVGADAQEACDLLESKGFKTLKKKESSYIYETGQVTRTDPAAGTPLKAGETVYVYISTGKEVVTAPMPNVIGLEVDRAMELMAQLGFNNVRYEEVESQKPAGQVIYQSVEKNTDADVTAEVIIHFSKGPQETEATEPVETQTEPAVTESTISVSFLMPEMTEEFKLEVCISGTTEILVSKMIAPGSTSAYVSLTGSGLMYFDLYINGEYYRTQDVEF